MASATAGYSCDEGVRGAEVTCSVDRDDGCGCAVDCVGGCVCVLERDVDHES